MRKIVKPADVALIFGISPRQASRILATLRKTLGKEKHHCVTVTEFVTHFGIAREDVEDVIFYNDN